MDTSVAINSLSLVAQLVIWILIAGLLGGFVAGILRVMTGIEEEIVGIAFRAIAIFGLVFLFAEPGWALILEFTTRIWDGSDTYFF